MFLITMIIMSVKRTPILQMIRSLRSACESDVASLDNLTDDDDELIEVRKKILGKKNRKKNVDDVDNGVATVAEK